MYKAMAKKLFEQDKKAWVPKPKSGANPDEEAQVDSCLKNEKLKQRQHEIIVAKAEEWFVGNLPDWAVSLFCKANQIPLLKKGNDEYEADVPGIGPVTVRSPSAMSMTKPKN